MEPRSVDELLAEAKSMEWRKHNRGAVIGRVPEKKGFAWSKFFSRFAMLFALHTLVWCSTRGYHVDSVIVCAFMACQWRRCK